MTLEQVLERLDEFDDESLIFAEKNPTWTPSSRAAVIPFPDDENVPHEPEGMEYLLEVFLAKEVLQVWSEWRGGRIPTAGEKIAALEHYHNCDSYLPIGNGG
jgi:hypothetical protein